MEAQFTQSMINQGRCTVYRITRIQNMALWEFYNVYVCLYRLQTEVIAEPKPGVLHVYMCVCLSVIHVTLPYRQKDLRSPSFDTTWLSLLPITASPFQSSFLSPNQEIFWLEMVKEMTERVQNITAFSTRRGPQKFLLCHQLN